MKKQEKRIHDAVLYMQNYLNTYDKQEYYLTYTDEIYIDDMLYGIGVSLDHQKYRMADGYYRFLTTLKEHIDKHLEDHKPVGRMVKEDLV